jgi:hypothetical protein
MLTSARCLSSIISHMACFASLCVGRSSLFMRYVVTVRAKHLISWTIWTVGLGVHISTA